MSVLSHRIVIYVAHFFLSGFGVFSFICFAFAFVRFTFYVWLPSDVEMKLLIKLLSLLFAFLLRYSFMHETYLVAIFVL